MLNSINHNWIKEKENEDEKIKQQWRMEGKFSFLPR